MFWNRLMERGVIPYRPPLGPAQLRPPVGRPVTEPDESVDLPAPAELKGRPLGRVLVKLRKVTRQQVVEALRHQMHHGGMIGDVMVKLGFVQAADVDAALRGQRGEST